jgi:hypothetical protein
MVATQADGIVVLFGNMRVGAKAREAQVNAPSKI